MEKIIWLILGISCETLYLFNKNTTIPRYSITRLEVLYPDLESAFPRNRIRRGFKGSRHKTFLADMMESGTPLHHINILDHFVRRYNQKDSNTRSILIFFVTFSF